MNKKIIKIGLDFDGVVAYNPLRIVRAPITLVKRHILRQKKTSFYVPTSALMKFLFWVPHEMSFFPGLGMDMLKNLVDQGKVEAHLISGRYAYLNRSLHTWLKRRKLDRIFTSIHTDLANEQPHIFKEQKLKELQLDYYIEDNLDIVEHLAQRVDTKILWIDNILDRRHSYPHKYPHLQKALEEIIR